MASATTATTATSVPAAFSNTLPGAATYWSEELGCTVRYSKPNEIFMIVDHEEEKDRTDDFYHVVFGEIQGWIGHRDWMVIERIL